MSNLDDSTRAVVRQSHETVGSLLNFREGIWTWDEHPNGRDVAWLETTKMDLTMLASVIESRIQELGQSDQDFGT